MNKEILLFAVQDLEELLDLKENYKIVDINVNKDFHKEGVPFLEVKILDSESKDTVYEGMEYLNYDWRYNKKRYKKE